MLNVEHLSVSI